MFYNGDLAWHQPLRQVQCRSDINDRNNVTTQIDDAKYMGWSGRDRENLWGNDNLGQQIYWYCIHIIANAKETNSYFLRRQYVCNIGGDVCIILGQ